MKKIYEDIKPEFIMFSQFVEFVHTIYPNQEFIPLHEPRFQGNEKKYLNACIDSTFVSSVGEYVNRLETLVAEYCKSNFAIATVNGTAALHIALLAVGVREDDEVLTQSLSFVATANAISYLKAKPLFLDVDRDTMGLSPRALDQFLSQNGEIRNGCCYNKRSGKRISACVPMHTFGHPVRIDKIVDVCNKYKIVVVEDSAESIGSLYKGKMTGTYGKLGVYSFNGNKTITSGGGGIVVTDDKELAVKLKHLTTTGKQPHKWNFVHDIVAYNYRMPNLNAALACAQLEQLDSFIDNKRKLAAEYQQFFSGFEISFIVEPEQSRSNYWLNCILLENREERDKFLEYTNSHGVMTRPVWTLLNKLEMYVDCQHDELTNSEWLEARIVNIPSSVRIDG